MPVPYVHGEYVPSLLGPTVLKWPAVRARLAAAAPALALVLGLPAFAQETNYQETLPLVYTILIISVVGAGLVFAFLLYAIVHFRDPATKGRKYG
jgi:hypothetical protein